MVIPEPDIMAKGMGYADGPRPESLAGEGRRVWEQRNLANLRQTEGLRVGDGCRGLLEDKGSVLTRSRNGY